MKTVNLGILAHVDAGKTSLTERLLHHAGVIDQVGRVDEGNTQTDSLAMERRRGITIRSAVVSFTIGDVRVNLIDTPGHADFISEVERALSVLDGVVLVVSAVEGIQAHTRLLMRTITAMGLPVILFVNKIDRAGAQYATLLEAMRANLSPSLIALDIVSEPGTRTAAVHHRDPADAAVAAEYAEVLADHDDTFTTRYLAEDPSLRPGDYDEALAGAVRGAKVYPVLFGSAATGAGVAAVAEAIPRFFPVNTSGPQALRGTVFKIERGWAGEKIGYVRMWSGQLTARETVQFHRLGTGGEIITDSGRVTRVAAFEAGTDPVERAALAGEIATVTGLKDLRIGDQLGTAEGLGAAHLFAPPSLETVVTPVVARDRGRLHEALTRLADADPFIGVRADGDGELSVRLYGQVQQEVIADTLAQEYDLAVGFTPLRTICVERVVGVGEAVDRFGERPVVYFFATVGLRVEPGEPGSGVTYRMSVELGSLPLAFHKAIEETVRSSLGQGLYGWEVSDVVVTLTHSGYSSVMSTAGDFRKLTPLVLMRALRAAGTRVIEPVNRFQLEAPGDCLGAVLAALLDSGATVESSLRQGGRCLVDGEIPVRMLSEFSRRLPGLSQGEGVLTSRFGGFRPTSGPAPARPRTDGNPLDRKEYLLRVLGRA